MLFRVILLTLCILVSCITGQTTTIPQRVQVRVGLDTVLQCSTKNTGDSVNWFGPNDVVLFFGSKRLTSDDRFTLNQKYRNSWDLQISNVKAADAGLYKCAPKQREPASDDIAKVFNLEVYVPPRIIPSKSSKDQFAQEGDNITLICFASGFPLPNIAWHKVSGNEEKLLYESYGQYQGQFVFSDITRNESGVYKCTAYNGEGMNDTRTMLVDVQYAPTISTNVLVKGLDVQLECMVEWNPQGENIWTKDREVIVQNWKYEPKIINDTSTQTTMILFINQIEGPTDFGQYSCIARNKYGNAIGNITMPVSTESSPGKGKNSAKENGVCKSLTVVLMTIFLSVYAF